MLIFPGSLYLGRYLCLFNLPQHFFCTKIPNIPITILRNQGLYSACKCQYYASLLHLYENPVSCQVSCNGIKTLLGHFKQLLAGYFALFESLITVRARKLPNYYSFILSRELTKQRIFK